MELLIWSTCIYWKICLITMISIKTNSHLFSNAWVPHDVMNRIFCLSNIETHRWCRIYYKRNEIIPRCVFYNLFVVNRLSLSEFYLWIILFLIIESQLITTIIPEIMHELVILSTFFTFSLRVSPFPLIIHFLEFTPRQIFLFTKNNFFVIRE